MTDIRRILFLSHTRIGDAVLATALLEHIRVRSPRAKVTIVTSPISAPLYAHYPLLERVLAVTKRSYNRHWLDLWREVGGTRFDEVWDLRDSLMTRCLRAGKTYRFRATRQPLPKVQQYAACFGIEPMPYPTLWAAAQHQVRAGELIPNDANVLAFGPCANWPPKEWPLEQFIALARSVCEGGFRPLMIAGPGERARAAPMLKALADLRPIDLTDGAEELLTIYAALSRCAGYVGNDSGLMHMAAAAGIPTLGLFGPTPATVYQPWGKRAAYLVAPDDNLAALTPEVVMARIKHLLTPI